MLWIVLNSLFRVGIMVIVVMKLTRHRDKCNCLECIGLGVTGGCALLTIPNIWLRAESPFDGWATTLFSLGVLLYLVGSIKRHLGRKEPKL